MPKFIETILANIIKLLICSVGVYLLWNGFMDVKFGLPQLGWTDSFIICLIGGFIAGTN